VDVVGTAVACTGQTGCATDGGTCSVASGLEDKLICAAGGGEAGLFVDTAGTATACAADTYSMAGEDSTAGCDTCAANENSDGTVACAACTSQTGCATDSGTCSDVSGLEDKLICAAGGGEAGFFVLHVGTPQACVVDTYSPAGEDSTAGCVGCAGNEYSDGTVACAGCTSQTGCATDGTHCSHRWNGYRLSGLDTKLICAAGGGEAGFFVDPEGTVTACAAGTYSTAGGTSTAGCVECAGNEYSDGTVACAACTSQTGCTTDGGTCSDVSGLEDKLICTAGGGETGYIVDVAGTAVACTGQTGCATDGGTCSDVSGLEDKLICTAGGGEAG
jgi:hypothetical protein